MRHVRPAQIKLVERAKFYTQVRNPNETVCDFIGRKQRSASKCSLQEHFDVALAGINKIKSVKTFSGLVLQILSTINFIWPPT